MGKNLKEIYEDTNIIELFEHAELKKVESERLAVEPYSYWSSVMREFFRKPSAIISLILVSIIILLAIFVPIFSNANIRTTNMDLRYLKPSFKYPFGTNDAGIDQFTRVWVGARASLMIALVVSLINTLVGVVVGTIWGYFRQLDLIMLEIYNFVVNVPNMLYYMIISYVLRQLGVNSIVSLIIAMTLIGWVGLARFIRNQILIYNNREYNIASRTLGSSPRRIIIYNLLPQILTVVIVTVSLQIPAVIGTEVGLSYFGIGLSVKDISLGRILRDSYQAWQDHPYILIYPALVVGLITIAFYLMGLALSDALDPKTHR